MTAAGQELVVPRHFHGPPSSGNGGWTAGAVVARLLEHAGAAPGAAVTVTLRRPPPLDEPLPLDLGDDGARLGPADAPVLLAQAAAEPPEALAPVPTEEARAARERYAGLRSHPFPGCFVCGTDRTADDGLRIFPGRVADDDEGRVRVAATWTPAAGHDPRAAYAEAWAALDCAGAWAGDLEERLMVLGRMTARVVALPAPGVEHVVVGVARGEDGRKTFTATTLRTADGDLVGAAEQVWIAVDPAAFG